MNQVNEAGGASLALFVRAALELSVTTGAEREDAAKRKTPHIRHHSASSICYLRLPFYNAALFLIGGSCCFEKTKNGESCSVVCVGTVMKDGLL